MREDLSVGKLTCLSAGEGGPEVSFGFWRCWQVIGSGAELDLALSTKWPLSVAKSRYASVVSCEGSALSVVPTSVPAAVPTCDPGFDPQSQQTMSPLLHT